MMAAIFAAVTAALVLNQGGRDRLALAALLGGLALMVWLFLFEIYSPEYGFRMPWLQGALDGRAPARG
jgi:hypothetical protein